jgi:serine/threonine protein kinase
MSPQDWDRCKQIFCDALELPRDERTLLVDRECSGNPALREQVFTMLAASTDESSPLDVGAAEQVVERLHPAEPLIAGDIVSGYRVLRIIGQGGTSLVYLAEHAGLRSPRRFAIKVIASAFIAGRQERFERECEILAAIEHPNIARIIDKGVTESGWPYLVMDYIEGTPFHKYCIDKKLAPPEVVRLTLDCCETVKYMHSKLIVHCDLKPSNILVDATSSPRLLDFGIARIIEPSRETRTGRTTRGIRPLTPDYASPEQLAGLPLTASTDIYSLGVVLYESLAGTLPFDNSGYPWPQISKKIAENDPAPPSKARLNSASTRDDMVFARHLHGDLDSIVLKALAHDPAQRYGSMDDLMADLKRYLAGEVVKARRSTVTNRVSKLLRRHRRGLAELLVAGLSIAVTIGLSSWYAQRERSNREIQYLDELRAIIRPLTLQEDVSGSARARGVLVDQASATIDSVSPIVSQHPELVPDLADALLRTGDLLGNPYGASLGRVDEARKWYHRAFDLVNRRTDARCVDVRARAFLGLGDTYNHPALARDPVKAADWYRLALREISPKSAQFRNTAAVAHGRMGMLCELLGSAEDARAQYRAALRLFPAEITSEQPLDSGLILLRRAWMEPPEVRGATYEKALESLDRSLRTDNQNSRIYSAVIEAHLSLGATELQPLHLSSAEKDFASAAALARQILTQDPEDLQERRALAVALRRSALIPAIEGRIANSNVLRAQATEVLRSTMGIPVSKQWDVAANPSCSETVERFSEGQSPMPLGHGDLLIANGRAGNIPGKLLVFSPSARELSVLAEGGYLSDMVDVAYASRTEIYVVDRSLSGTGGVVRLRYQGGRWLQKPITCGGLLRGPTAVAYHSKQLILADADEYSARLVGVDLQTGRQTLVGRTDTFAEPGKIVHAGMADYFLSLFWPGEAGSAEIVRFNANTHKFAVAARYGLFQNPVALAITPRGDLIAGDRGWVANRGRGDIFRISRGGVQKVVCESPELSRVTAVAVAFDRNAWYVTAEAPFSFASLYELDLLTGHSEQIMSGGLLGAPRALVRVY